MWFTLRNNWLNFLKDSLKKIPGSPKLAFTNMTPKDIPEVAAVYLITVENKLCWVGRTQNLRSRIYSQHLMGDANLSLLKRGLVDSRKCVNLQETKLFLRKKAVVRWIEEKNMRKRYALECYFTAVLRPKYSMNKEH